MLQIELERGRDAECSYMGSNFKTTQKNARDDFSFAFMGLELHLRRGVAR